MTGLQSEKGRLHIDLFTVMAISVIVYIIKNVLHELVGHGGAGFLVGAKLISFTTAYFESDTELVSELGKRFIAMAGALVNFTFGIVSWAFLRIRIKSSSWKFFLWLSMAVNLLVATGYPLFSGLIGIGDGIEVINGLGSIWFWRIILTISGLILYVAAIWVSLYELNKLIGDDANRKIRAFKFSFFPYISGSIATTVGSFLNPTSMLFVFTSAAASFGGTSALAWMIQLIPTKLFSPKSGLPLQIKRNWLWIISSLLLLFLHIFVIGPGIRF